MKDTSLKPSISVIIPTFNRADLLCEALKSLTKQSIPKDEFEVVVIDDGSSDNTEDVCRGFEKSLNIIYNKQINSGIAAAKNLGIFMSSSPLLFFFDDDDVADANLLAEHIRTHRLHPEENTAVLGYTTWHPSLKITPLMHYVTDVGGFLFSCEHLKDKQELDFTYFWGGRSSCKRSFLVRNGVFNQQFTFGSEDIELGYRLSKFGLRVVFNRKAISYMIRPLTFDQFCTRCVKQGRSQYHFGKMHPDPVITSYCMLEDAEEKWAYARQFVEEKAQKARELEKKLERGVPKANKKELQNQLWSLYRWIFTVLKLKGIVEEKEKDQGARATDNLSFPAMLADVPRKDLDILRSRLDERPQIRHGRGNVLIIDPLLPMYDRASGSLRLFEIIKALIRMGFGITYIARSSDHAETYVPILQRMGVEVYAGDPTALQAYWPDVIAPYLDVEKILRSKTFDFVILSFWHIAEHYLPLVRKHSPNSTVIIDTVDIHFLREFREAEMKKDRSLMETARRNKERELAIYQEADRIWVVTEDDREAIKHLVKPTIDVVPNIHKHVHETKEFSNTSGLLFVGNFNHRPNIDAVQFLHEKILPHIRKHLPDVKVYIVGNNPPETIRKLNSDLFVVTGYVEDLGPYLRKSRISINPLTYGAGMKGKIGEALSWGLPVVTTTIGAEGMDLEDREHAMIADDPKEFAKRVVELYHDKHLWEKLSRNGKSLVEQRWSPGAIQRRIESSLLNCVRFNEDEVSLAFPSTTPEQIEKLASIHASVEIIGDTIVVINRGELRKDSAKLFKLVKKHENSSRKPLFLVTETDSPHLARWNKALSQCKGGLIVLVGHDVNHADLQTINSLVSFAHEHPDIDMVVTKTIPVPFEENARHSNSTASITCDAGTPADTAEDKDDKCSIMILRPSALKAIGGFDTRFHDIGLAWYDYLIRAHIKGCRVWSIKDSGPAILLPAPNIPDCPDRDLFLEKWSRLVSGSEDADHAVNDLLSINDPLSLFISLGATKEDSPRGSDQGDTDESDVEKQQSGDVSALTSIIILCYNGLHLTRMCLESIEKFTPEPHEIILVDNGSKDGTTDFLKGYAEKHSHVKLIMNTENKGYAAGNNQAISMAQGSYIVLLNNDVVVTEGWLGRMIDHMGSHKDIGMVGPVTNSVSGIQLIPNVPYGNNLEQMHKFARELSQRNRGRTEPSLRLVGYCLLVKKEVLDIVGGLDEGYKTGNFEDDDLCLRSSIAGYRNIVAKDVFVHHFGSMTFKENAIDHSKTMDENRAYFLRKWEGLVEMLENNIFKVSIDTAKRIQRLNEWGEKAYGDGDILRALRIFERALHLDPKNTTTLNNIGVIHWELGKKDEAIGIFQHVLRIDPNNLDAQSNIRNAMKGADIEFKETPAPDTIITPRTTGAVPATREILP